MIKRWSMLLIVATLFVFDLSAQQDIQELVKANYELNESELLDVSILIFDPGLPKKNEYKKEDKGVFPAVRRAESTYIPVRLMETLQATGYWGLVRVVPANYVGGEIRISGVVKYSSGFRQTLQIHAVDATGKTFLKKNYKARADIRGYRQGDLESVMVDDPFHYLYNRIANDLLDRRNMLRQEDFKNIRQVNDLKFAASLAPDVFGDYLKVRKRKKGNRYKILKLPTADDPMLDRVAMIRDRDDLLTDTLTAYYNDFALRMAEPYNGWRKSSYEEEEAMRKIRREARAKQIAGALLVIGAIMADGDSNGSRAAQQVGVIAGSQILQQGIQQSAESKMHSEALKELAASLDGEIRPILVEMQGRTIKLRGAAEAQYESWRQMLQEIFNTEMGAPIDPNNSTPTESGGPLQ